MRYNIMLQLVAIITIVLTGTAALFAWLQERDASQSFAEAIPSCLEPNRQGNDLALAEPAWEQSV